MLRRVLHYIREYGLILPGERVLTAVSGGVDSCVLLDCLVRLRREIGCQLYVAHLNHQLRGEEADADARFVRELAAEYGVPLIEESQDVARFARERRQGIEVSGRQLRYEFFLRAARKTSCQVVAVAHHADDQVETILWRLLRGSGSRGLRGMSPVRSLAEKRLIRPLLPFYREEIEAYARQQNLPYRTDATNSSWQYTRNRIRHELLPLLATYNPRIKERLLGLAEQLGREDQLLDQLAREWLEKWFRRPAQAVVDKCGLASGGAIKGPGGLPGAGGGTDSVGLLGTGGGELPLRPFRDLHPALQWRVGKLILEYLLEAADVRRIHVADMHQLATSADSGAVLHLPNGWIARRTAEAIRFEQATPELTTPDYTYAFLEGGTLFIPEAGVTLVIERLPCPPPMTHRLQAVFDARTFPSQDVVIRNRRPGDWMRLEASGARGRQTFTKKVKALMNEAKWSNERRWRMPLLALGDEVLWVPGLRQSVRFRVSEETKDVWCVVLREEHRGGNHGAGHFENPSDTRRN